jgi:hypothetical protein
MKKAIILTSLLMSLISCTNFKNKNKEISAKNSTKIETNTQMWTGIITKLEMSTFQYGTHLLNGIPLDGNPDNVSKSLKFALKSDKVNLDEWIGKKVIITGSKVNGYPVENGPDFINVTAIEVDQRINLKNK